MLFIVWNVTAGFRACNSVFNSRGKAEAWIKRQSGKSTDVYEVRPFATVSLS